MDSLEAIQDLIQTPLWGGIYPLKALLGLLLFYGTLEMSRRLRRWLDSLETDRPTKQQAKLRRWGTRSVLILGTLASIGVAGLPLSTLLSHRMTTLGDTELTLMTLLTAGLVVFLSWWFSQLVQEAMQGSFRRRGLTEEGTLNAINRLLHYGVMAVGLGVALQTMGVNLAALFAAGAVFAVGIGFALQNIVQNFVSGVILLVERSITTRDVLEIEGRVVVVENIGIRSTVVRNQDDEEVIVPNGILVQTTVKNLTLSDPLIRVRATVGVHYESDMEQVAEVLANAAKGLPSQAENKPPAVLLLGFGPSSVDWEVSIWTRHPWGLPEARSDLHRAIWRALKQADITIAYPQLDVNLKREEAL